MSWKEIKQIYQTKKSQKKKTKHVKIKILSYYPHQTEKNNYLGKKELAPGKTLTSREIIIEAVFLAQCKKCLDTSSQLLPQIGECILDANKLCLNRHSNQLIGFLI